MILSIDFLKDLSFRLKFWSIGGFKKFEPHPQCLYITVINGIQSFYLILFILIILSKMNFPSIDGGNAIRSCGGLI